MGDYLLERSNFKTSCFETGEIMELLLFVLCLVSFNRPPGMELQEKEAQKIKAYRNSV